VAQRVKLVNDRLASRIASSFVFFWAAGLGFMWWVITPVFMALRSKTKIKASAETKLLVSLGLWLLLVIVASTAGGAVALNRIPGAAFGAVAWIAAGIMFHVLRKLTPEQNFHFIRGLILIGSIQGLLTFAAVMAHPSPLSRFSLPAASAIGGASGVGAWAASNLAYVDYFGGGIVRSAGLMATAAWSGGYACLILILLVTGRRKLMASGMGGFKWLMAVALNFSSLYFAYSRVSVAILILVVTIYALYRACSWLVAGELLATVVVVGGAVLMFAFLPWQEYIAEQDSLRPGSSDARFTSYLEGFEVAAAKGPMVFLAGNGAKPFLEELGRGAGSESTYVSLLVRGGLIAVALFLFFLLARFARAWKAQDWTAVLLFIALAIHAVVEDLDVGTLTLLLILIEPARIALTAKNPPDAKGPALSPAYGHIAAQQAGESVMRPGR
jgi:hypothetical protein